MNFNLKMLGGLIPKVRTLLIKSLVLSTNVSRLQKQNMDLSCCQMTFWAHDNFLFL